jgi:hypothetical protein
MAEEILVTYTMHSLILVIIAGDLKGDLAVVYLWTLLLVMVLFHPPITMAFLYTPMRQQMHCPPPHQYQIQPIGIPTIGNGAF